MTMTRTMTRSPNPMRIPTPIRMSTTRMSTTRTSKIPMTRCRTTRTTMRATTRSRCRTTTRRCRCPCCRCCRRRRAPCWLPPVRRGPHRCSWPLICLLSPARGPTAMTPPTASCRCAMRSAVERTGDLDRCEPVGTRPVDCDVRDECVNGTRKFRSRTSTNHQRWAFDPDALVGARRAALPVTTRAPLGYPSPPAIRYPARGWVRMIGGPPSVSSLARNRPTYTRTYSVSVT